MRRTHKKPGAPSRAQKEMMTELADKWGVTLAGDLIKIKRYMNGPYSIQHIVSLKGYTTIHKLMIFDDKWKAAIIAAPLAWVNTATNWIRGAR